MPSSSCPNVIVSIVGMKTSRRIVTAHEYVVNAVL